MRIGIDARPLLPPLAGIGYYFLNIIKCLEQIDQSNEFYLYSNTDFTLPFINSRWKKRIGYGPFGGIGTLWMLTQGSMMVMDDRINVFWAPWPIQPFFLPIKKVITVHDFTWMHCSQTMHWSQKILYKVLGRVCLSKADAIFAISKSTMQDVVSSRKTADNVHLTYNGVNDGFKPFDRLESAKYIARQYYCSDKYILNVGTLEPRKNIISLLRAFKIFKDKYKTGHQLLIAGAKGWQESAVYAEYDKLQLKDDVIFLDYVSDEDMPKLYCGAGVFVFPSLYEGFGFPVLEAMACACPVIASDNSSLPEVLGEAGFLIDPFNCNVMADKIYTLLTDQHLADSFRAKGLERAKLFSWPQTAQTILNVLTKLK